MSELSWRSTLVLAAGWLIGMSWGAPRSAGAEAPVVAGFDRLFARGAANPVPGGLLLMGELNCTSCHAASPGLDNRIERKQAPILDGVGLAIRPDYLRSFLSDPHGVKPGTTMPDVFGNWPQAEKTEAVEALTHFLAATGRVRDAKIDPRAVGRGRNLYHEVGCVACHGPLEERRGERDSNKEGTTAPPAVNVPLPNLAAKTTVPALTAFLLDPHRNRPSGRMPALNLKPAEAGDVAQYLLRGLRRDVRPNVAYRVYEGRWESLPDFDQLKPISEGQCEGFDLTLAPRPNNVALRFEGSLRLERAGEYTFMLGSDDGGRLWIDGQLVVDNDGIHPVVEKEETVRLANGNHQVAVAVFNGGGGFELETTISGPNITPRPLGDMLTLAPTSAPEYPAAHPEAVADDPDRLSIDPALAAKGKELFARVGCASCHQLREGGRPIGTQHVARTLESLGPSGGCLDDAGGRDVPRYGLDAAQRSALVSVLVQTALLGEVGPRPEERISRTLATFNCVACHQRGAAGGVELAHDPYFATTQPEMGEEGRLPPLLNGVGAKLRPDYLKRVVAEGLTDRPYMKTRMPRFGNVVAEPLAIAFEQVDRINPVPVPEFDDSIRKVKSTGRFLAGGQGLGCVKCHTFKGIRAEGVQAIDMTVMTRRLNRDWFHRYVVNPPEFRPGTRMPTGWPDGKAALKDIYDGDTVKQVESVWKFLEDGPAAAEPYGLGREPMPLIADKEAVIYRNFIAGAGPRAIGVGYPEKANIAFDANQLRLAVIWQGAFIDAAKHWTGRGDGFQPPLGDNVLPLPEGPAFAALPNLASDWPTRTERDPEHAFKGYRLTSDRRPTFLYEVNGVRVEDFITPVVPPDQDQKPPALRRSLAFSSDAPAANLYFRAAVASSIKPQENGWFLVDDEWRLRLDPASEAVVRFSRGRAELLVPVKLENGKGTLIEEFQW